MAVIYTPHFAQFFDGNGDPLSGGLLYTYAAGTTTPKSTYTTATGDIEKTNPIVLDSSGRATFFIDGAYKFSLYDSEGTLVKTTDNITSFTTTGESASAFFESFSGDGSTTSFTTSEDLGTDERLLMVFVDNGLNECVDNGDFASSSTWVLGSGWSIGSGVATATGAISTAISQTSQVTLEEGEAYVVTMTITSSAGGLIPSVGGTSGTERTSDGTYSEIIIAGSTQSIVFTGNGFTGTIDDISVAPANPKGFDILPPSSFTIDGTTLTFGSAPSYGTNNIQVWAPSLLAAAASSSAASAASSSSAAATSEANALSYATDAATAQTAAEVAQTAAEVAQGLAETAQTAAEDAADEAELYAWGAPSAWITATDYYVRNVVTYNGSSYYCIIEHTSGVFADDLAANKWALIASAGEMSGPGSSTNNNIASFDGTDGTTLKDSGIPASATLGALAGLTGASNKVPRFTGSGTADMLDFKDEDDMVSDSDTAVPSQQSVKAYVDSATPDELSTASGSAPSYSARAWARYDGGVSASGNVASISHPSSGVYTVTFTTAMQTANYGINVSADRGIHYSVQAALSSVSKAGFTLTFKNQAGSLADAAFSIIIME